MIDPKVYIDSHPPRCLDNIDAEAVDLSGIVFDGHGEELNGIFRVWCGCGELTHYVLGHYWVNPDYKNLEVFLSPLALRCISCGKINELIDTDIHGYDAELGHGSGTVRGEGERDEYKCKNCGVQPFEIIARFEYSEELFGKDFEDFRGREQDLFSWFTLLGRCTSCKEVWHIADFECD